MYLLYSAFIFISYFFKISVFPFQHNPINQTLTVTQNLEIELISITDTYETSSQSGSRAFESIYENLITNSEDKIKELIKFCNVKWDSNCLNFHKNKKVVATASLAQVRQPIYKASVKQWENYKNELLLLKKIIN